MMIRPDADTSCCDAYQNSMADLYKAMRTLDANGDGKIDKDEFVSWFAQRSLELA